MPAPMARQEHDFGSAEAPDPQRVRSLAPGRSDPLLARILEAGKVVDARAADDAEDGLGHALDVIRAELHSSSSGGAEGGDPRTSGRVGRPFLNQMVGSSRP